MKNLFKPKFRIIPDNYNGFECQVKVWWNPYWMEVNFSNSNSSIKEAETFQRLYGESFAWGISDVFYASIMIGCAIGAVSLFVVYLIAS